MLAQFLKKIKQKIKNSVLLFTVFKKNQAKNKKFRAFIHSLHSGAQRAPQAQKGALK